MNRTFYAGNPLFSIKFFNHEKTDWSVLNIIFHPLKI